MKLTLANDLIKRCDQPILSNCDDFNLLDRRKK